MNVKQFMTSVVLAPAALVLLAGVVHAADYTIPAKLLLLKPGRLNKSFATGTFTLPDTVGALPTDTGAGLRFRVNGAGCAACDALFFQGASTWKALGPAGAPSGYLSRNGDCKHVLLKTNVFKAICPALTTDSPLPLDANADVTVTLEITNGLGNTATRYCASCGGTPSGNAGKLTKRRACDAPASCPPVARCCQYAGGYCSDLPPDQLITLCVNTGGQVAVGVCDGATGGCKPQRGDPSTCCDNGTPHCIEGPGLGGGTCATTLVGGTPHLGLSCVDGFFGACGTP